MIFGDETYKLFIERMYDALCREKFNREQPYNETPSNIPSSRKFYIELNEKKIFICLPNLFFEKLIFELWKYAKNTESDKLPPEELIRKLYNDKQLFYQETSLIYNYNEFKETLEEESFIFIDDLENQYYFNLF